MGDYGSRYPEKGRGNGLIYFLVFIIILLLIGAGAMVYYFSTQMMEMKKEVAVVRHSAVQPNPSVQPVPAPRPKPQPVSAAPAKLAAEDIATIVQVVMTQMQKNQKPTPDPVPAPTPKPAKAVSKTEVSVDDTVDDLESMIDVLENVDVDTVDEEPLSITPDKKESLMQTQAGSMPDRANDNYNKVHVADDMQDEFARLSNEIDQLVQEETVSENPYRQQMQKAVIERENEMRTIVVREGDTLTSLARKAYGDARQYVRILRANPGIIKNPDRIFVGQVLRVPQ